MTSAVIWLVAWVLFFLIVPVAVYMIAVVFSLSQWAEERFVSGFTIIITGIIVAIVLFGLGLVNAILQIISVVQLATG